VTRQQNVSGLIELLTALNVLLQAPLAAPAKSLAQRPLKPQPAALARTYELQSSWRSTGQAIVKLLNNSSKLAAALLMANQSPNSGHIAPDICANTLQVFRYKAKNPAAERGPFFRVLPLIGISLTICPLLANPRGQSRRRSPSRPPGSIEPASRACTRTLCEATSAVQESTIWQSIFVATTPSAQRQ